MKGVDWPLIFVAATSLLGFGVQKLDYKNLYEKVDSLENTKSDVASLKLQYSAILEELEKVQKLSMNDIAGSRKLSEESPFTKDKYGWWVADSKMFRFPQGVVIGDHYKWCNYGKATLSVGLVDMFGTGNCPEGEGSVTFGMGNSARGRSSTVTGGLYNDAMGDYSSVTGGVTNSAKGSMSTVTGGEKNKATGRYSSVTGGELNEAMGENSSVTGGGRNIASGTNSTVTGGSKNTAKGMYSSVTGGEENTAPGHFSAIAGGLKNEVDGKFAVITGGTYNTAEGFASSISGGHKNKVFAKGIRSSILGGRWHKVNKKYETEYMFTF